MRRVRIRSLLCHEGGSSSMETWAVTAVMLVAALASLPRVSEVVSGRFVERPNASVSSAIHALIPSSDGLDEPRGNSNTREHVSGPWYLQLSANEIVGVLGQLAEYGWTAIRDLPSSLIHLARMSPDILRAGVDDPRAVVDVAADIFEQPFVDIATAVTTDDRNAGVEAVGTLLSENLPTKKLMMFGALARAGRLKKIAKGSRILSRLAQTHVEGADVRAARAMKVAQERVAMKERINAGFERAIERAQWRGATSKSLNEARAALANPSFAAPFRRTGREEEAVTRFRQCVYSNPGCDIVAARDSVINAIEAANPPPASLRRMAGRVLLAVWNTAVVTAAGGVMLGMMSEIVQDKHHPPPDQLGSNVMNAIRSTREDIQIWLAWLESQARELGTVVRQHGKTLP